MKNTQKGFLYIPIILLVLILGGAGYWIVKSVKHKVENGEEKVACTLDAKQCSDGSYVGRVAPNCEFAKCPTEFTPESLTENDTAGLNQKIFLGNGVYVTPLKVLSDSRCPTDVQCIWAGEVNLKFKYEKDMQSKELEVKEGESVDAGPVAISLVDVTPENNTKKPFADKDYRFTFKLSWKLD